VWSFSRAPAARAHALRRLVWSRSAGCPHVRAARRACWGPRGLKRAARARLSGTGLDCLGAAVLCRPTARAGGNGRAPRSPFSTTRSIHSSWTFLPTARAMRAGRGRRVTEKFPFVHVDQRCNFACDRQDWRCLTLGSLARSLGPPGVLGLLARSDRQIPSYLARSLARSPARSLRPTIREYAPPVASARIYPGLACLSRACWVPARESERERLVWNNVHNGGSWTLSVWFLGWHAGGCGLDKGGVSRGGWRFAGEGRVL
jgi:hypothetical protein